MSTRISAKTNSPQALTFLSDVAYVRLQGDRHGISGGWPASWDKNVWIIGTKMLHENFIGGTWGKGPEGILYRR